MKATPHAILLVPTEGDPHGLLKWGLCGARPPVAWHGVCPHHGPVGAWREDCLHGICCTTWGGPTRCPRHVLKKQALVLAWEGQSIPEGLDRAMRRLEAVTEGAEDRGLQEYDLWWCRLADAGLVGEACVDHRLGTTVYLYSAKETS